MTAKLRVGSRGDSCVPGFSYQVGNTVLLKDVASLSILVRSHILPPWWLSSVLSRGSFSLRRASTYLVLTSDVVSVVRKLQVTRDRLFPSEGQLPHPSNSGLYVYTSGDYIKLLRLVILLLQFNHWRGDSSSCQVPPSHCCLGLICILFEPPVRTLGSFGQLSSPLPFASSPSVIWDHRHRKSFPCSQGLGLWLSVSRVLLMHSRVWQRPHSHLTFTPGKTAKKIPRSSPLCAGCSQKELLPRSGNRFPSDVINVFVCY